MNGLLAPYGERFLQILWNERHLVDELVCEGGERVQVLTQGTWNSGAGPDFSQAALMIDGRLRRGDVEVHRSSRDWIRHGHNEDDAYREVILHVVGEDDGGTPDLIPVLVLQKHLLADWELFLQLIDAACYSRASEIPVGECALRWAMTEDCEMREILIASGLARFAGKSSVFARVSENLGREQALYEALLECLGYRENRVPFRILARRIPLKQLQNMESDLERCAVLFGAAGLLPDPTMEDYLPGWAEKIGRMWECWWRHRDGSEPLPWSHRSMRPYNTPWRRLAAGVSFLEATEYAPAAWLAAAAESASSPKELIRKFADVCRSPEELHGMRSFSQRISPAAELLGRARQLDLFANILLPFLHGLSSPGSREAELARSCWLQLPIGQENQLCREAALRLFLPPSRGRDVVKSCGMQQGLMNIYQNFCLALGNNCEACPLMRTNVNRPL